MFMLPRILKWSASIAFSVKYLWFYQNQPRANDCEKSYHMKILLLIAPPPHHLLSSLLHCLSIKTIVHRLLLSPQYERYQFLTLLSAYCQGYRNDYSDTEHRFLAHHPAWGTAFTYFQTPLVFEENRAMSHPVPSLHHWTWRSVPSPGRSQAAEMEAMCSKTFRLQEYCT